MISKNRLKQAVNKNIIEPEQLEPLYQFLQGDESNVLNDQNEPLKFVRSFGDIFITLGILLLVIAINMTNISGYYYLLPVIGFVALAEWLVRVRHLVLPGIAILISILFFVNKAVPFGYDDAIVGLGVLSLSSLLYYLRYKMPFSLLPLAMGLVLMPVVQIGLRALDSPSIFISFGVIVFLIALWFDAQDTKRQSHLSDNAFWLFLLASPLIVHGVMVSVIFHENSWLAIVNKEIVMTAFLVIFFLVSLLIDRRAILISTQLYVIYALTQLLQKQLDSVDNILIYILIGLSFFVIYFGTYWYKTRRLIFGFLAGSVITKYVPALDIEDLKKSS